LDQPANIQLRAGAQRAGRQHVIVSGVDSGAAQPAVEAAFVTESEGGRLCETGRIH
jgi:hypothetical protein